MENEKKIIVAPSILAADFSCLGSEVKRLEDACADWVHVDVMDGHFVPNLTIGHVVVRDLRKRTKLFIDSHLMIENPERYVDDFVILHHSKSLQPNRSYLMKPCR